MNWKRNLLRAALGGTLLLGAALLPSGTAQARDCSDRIRSEEIKLQRDIERHGFFSRQAAHRRQKVSELRESCAQENRRFFWGRDRDRDDSRWRRDRDGRWHDRDNDRDRDDRGRWRDRDGRWHDRDDRRWRDRDGRWHDRDNNRDRDNRWHRDRDDWRHRDRDHDRD